jgi:lauroyl/myristoyl acyltransferase
MSVWAIACAQKETSRVVPHISRRDARLERLGVAFDKRDQCDGDVEQPCCELNHFVEVDIVVLTEQIIFRQRR